MVNMFYNCENLKHIDLSRFNTENVIQMDSMFENCKNLIEINLSSFNTQNVTSMSKMFYNCSNLKNLDLSSFITERVINIDQIFTGCNDKIINSNKTRFKRFYFDEDTQTFKEFDPEYESTMFYLDLD